MGTKAKPSRASYGSVSLQELKDRRRLKYRYGGREFYVTLPGRPSVYDEQLKKIIELDILCNNHDNTLKKYKDFIKNNTVPVPVATREPVFILHESLKHFLQTTGRTLDKDLYYNTYRMVLKWGDTITCLEIPQLLTGMGYSAKTFNNRKLVLNAYCEWMVRNGKISYNPLKDIPSRRKTGRKNSCRRRLTDSEIMSVLNAIKTDKYIKDNSHRYNHSFYYPIFYFLIRTGVRPAEAIGLQVKKVDFDRKVIVIDQALARTRKGTSAKNRIMKGTKMDDWREIPFGGDSELEEVLLKQCAGKDENALVFTSPTGLACDDRKLNDSVLKPVLDGLKIPRRILYAFRHSFISRCFERGMDIKSVQALTGHKDVSILLNTYAEAVKCKVSLPML